VKDAEFLTFLQKLLDNSRRSGTHSKSSHQPELVGCFLKKKKKNRKPAERPEKAIRNVPPLLRNIPEVHAAGLIIRGGMSPKQPEFLLIKHAFGVADQVAGKTVRSVNSDLQVDSG
jgi:hypothetical protein